MKLHKLTKLAELLGIPKSEVRELFSTTQVKEKQNNSSKLDSANVLRVYKNRMALLCKALYEDISEFDTVFFKVMNRYHIGEVTAFNDMLQTYMARAYKLGIMIGEKGLASDELSEERIW